MRWDIRFFPYIGTDTFWHRLQTILVISTSLISNDRLTTGNKLLWKRKEIASALFYNIFNIFNFRSQITYSVVKCGCSIYFLLISANLICRGTDISKYLGQSLRLRDNKSRLKVKMSHIFFDKRITSSSGILLFILLFILSGPKSLPTLREFWIPSKHSS